MALCTDQRTHILMSGIGKLQGAFSIQGTFEMLAGYSECHGFRIMAVGTANRVDDFIAVLGPGAGEKFQLTIPRDQPGDIRRLAGPAGGRLRPGLTIHRRTGAQSVLIVFQHVEVAAGRVVVLGKGVPCPQNGQGRGVFNSIHQIIALPGLHVGIILTGIVLGPFGGTGFPGFHLRGRVDPGLIRLVFPDGNGQQHHQHKGKRSKGRDNK